MPPEGYELTKFKCPEEFLCKKEEFNQKGIIKLLKTRNIDIPEEAIDKIMTEEWLGTEEIKKNGITQNDGASLYFQLNNKATNFIVKKGEINKSNYETNKEDTKSHGCCNCCEKCCCKSK